MTKQEFKPSTTFDQDKENPTLYHNGYNINDPQFDFEGSFCSRLNKLQAVSDLFFCMGEGSDRQLTSNGAFGIHYVLHDIAEELRSICYKMLKGGAE